MIAAERLEGVVGGLVDDEVLLDPPSLAIWRPHLIEAALVPQDRQLLSVADWSDFARDRRDSITQPCLFRYDIDNVRRARRGAMAAGEKSAAEKATDKREPTRRGCARIERENSPVPTFFDHDLFQVYRRARMLASPAGGTRDGVEPNQNSRSYGYCSCGITLQCVLAMAAAPDAFVAVAPGSIFPAVVLSKEKSCKSGVPVGVPFRFAESRNFFD